MTIKDLLGEYFTEDDVCVAMGWELPTLRSDRSRNVDHPPFIKRGRRILYPKDKFINWFHKTSKSGKARLRAV
jgi:hypothetical protein